MGKKFLSVVMQHRVLIIGATFFIGSLLGFSNLEIGFIAISVSLALALSKEEIERGCVENCVNQLSKTVKRLEEGQKNLAEFFCNNYVDKNLKRKSL